MRVRVAVMVYLVAAATACATITVSGCGSSHETRHTSSADLPDDCNAFISAYRRYLAAASPGAGAIAEARARQTRTALEEEVRHGDSSALGKKCRENLRTIPTSRTESSSSQ